jgi:hypothetical protein
MIARMIRKTTRVATRTAVFTTVGTARVTASASVKAAHAHKSESSALPGILIVVCVSLAISLVQIIH